MPRTDAAARPNRGKQARSPAIPTSTSLWWPYAKPVILYPPRSATARQELRSQGAAMSMDEAVAYALANINPKLLTGPMASIDG